MKGYERMKHGLVILCMMLDIQWCIWSTTFACGNFLMSDECILFTLRISDIWLHCYLGYSLFPQMSRFGEGKTPQNTVWTYAIYIFTDICVSGMRLNDFTLTEVKCVTCFTSYTSIMAWTTGAGSLHDWLGTWALSCSW